MGRVLAKHPAVFLVKKNPFVQGFRKLTEGFDRQPDTLPEPPAEISDAAQKSAQEAASRERSRRRRAKGRGATILTGPLAEADIGRKTLGGA